MLLCVCVCIPERVPNGIIRQMSGRTTKRVYLFCPIVRALLNGHPNSECCVFLERKIQTDRHTHTHMAQQCNVCSRARALWLIKCNRAHNSASMMRILHACGLRRRRRRRRWGAQTHTRSHMHKQNPHSTIESGMNAGARLRTD